MNAVDGIIFDISRFCLNDGPGIRTTVFLKGCPLKCAWCHNPESQRVDPEILFSAERCTLCGACAAACHAGAQRMGENGRSIDRSLCTGCGECANACRAGALRLAGRRVTADEVLREVLKDKEFYEESGGGMTVSGGEPLMQGAFLEALLTGAKANGLHTCLETCGFGKRETIERIAPLVDIFLFDWKESDPVKHREFTGVDNRLIRENLKYLSDTGHRIVLRLPFIPGYNDTREHAEGIISLANALPGIMRMEIMPYHPLGISKARQLGRKDYEDQSMELPDNDQLTALLEALCGGVGIPVEINT